MNPKAEIIRIQYKYRQMILRGKTELKPGEATWLIGPDSAYHLYSRYKGHERIEKSMGDT